MQRDRNPGSGNNGGFKESDAAMSVDSTNVFLTFPPRSLGDGEREIVREWLAGTHDIATAYISERRGDDPAHFRKIVIVEAGSRSPSYLVHSPNGTDVWIVAPQDDHGAAHHFPHLRAALAAIRTPDPANARARSSDERMGLGAVADRRGATINAGRARTIAEMAAMLRRPGGGDNAAAKPRRKPS